MIMSIRKVLLQKIINSVENSMFWVIFSKNFTQISYLIFDKNWFA